MQYINNFRAEKTGDSRWDQFVSSAEEQFNKISQTINARDILAKVPWIDVRADPFGAKGDWKTDAAPAINKAIQTLLKTSASLKSDAFTYHDCPTRGIIYLPPKHGFVIKSPIFLEGYHADTNNRIYADNIIIWAYGAELIADSSFTGVDRYYDPTHTETINAMIIMGIRDFGKYPGLSASPGLYWQNFNGIYGLTFIADQVTSIDINAVRMDLVRHPVVKDCIFDNFHCAIDGRAISLAQCENNRAVYVNSFYHQVNDSADIGWDNGEGIDAAGPMIDDLVVFRSKNYTSDSKYRNLGKIHLVNTGEDEINNAILFGGGGVGIFQANTQNPIKQHQYWSHYNNIRIAGMHYEPLYFYKYKRIRVNNLSCVYNQLQDHDTTNRPLIKLEDVREINMSNLLIDQTNDPTGSFAHYTSYPLLLKGGGCNFSNVNICAIPTTNNSYSYIYVLDGSSGYEADDNKFTTFGIGLYYPYGLSSPNKYQNGILCANGTNGNLFSNGTVKNCNSTRIILGDGNNRARNIITDESRDIASATELALLDHGKGFNITGTTDITSVTASWHDRIVALKFAGILTFTDGGNLKLNNDFVTSADDIIFLWCDGTNWYEISRSSN